MSFKWQNPKVFIGFPFSICISGGSASCFIDMIILVNLECTLAQTRVGFGRVILPSKRPMRGQYVFVIGFIFSE